MPRVNPLSQDGKVQQYVAALTRETRIGLIDHKISYTQIAKVLDLTPQAVSNQFRNNHITMEVYTTAQMLIRGEL